MVKYGRNTSLYWVRHNFLSCRQIFLKSKQPPTDVLNFSPVTISLFTGDADYIPLSTALRRTSSECYIWPLCSDMHVSYVHRHTLMIVYICSCLYAYIERVLIIFCVQSGKGSGSCVHNLIALRVGTSFSSTTHLGTYHDQSHFHSSSDQNQNANHACHFSSYVQIEMKENPILFPRIDCIVE